MIVASAATFVYNTVGVMQCVEQVHLQ